MVKLWDKFSFNSKGLSPSGKQKQQVVKSIGWVQDYTKISSKSPNTGV